MKSSLPPYVYRRKRGAKSYLYFERAGIRQRMPDVPSSPEFMRAYALLVEGKAVVAPPNKRNFAGLMDRYVVSEKFLKLSPRTKADYRKVMDYIREAMAEKRVDLFERRHAIAMRDANKSTVRFANYTVQVMSVLMEYAIDLGWRKAGTNPAQGVALLKSDKPPRKPWPEDLVEEYLMHSRGRSRLVFLLCLETGQRIGDVLRMRWDHIENGGINVRQGKTRKELWIPITPLLAEELARTPRDGMTILTGENGRPLTQHAASYAFRKVRDAIGAQGYDMHALRHTAASRLAERGFDDETIKSITGHESTAMVKLYAGAARQKARAQRVVENENGTGISENGSEKRKGG